MTQPRMDFSADAYDGIPVRDDRAAEANMSMNDRLEAFLKARPNRWIDGKELAEIAGGYAWRTRVSNLRRQRGMTILNDVVLLRDAHGKPFKISQYMYVPPVEDETTGYSLYRLERGA